MTQFSSAGAERYCVFLIHLLFPPGVCPSLHNGKTLVQTSRR